MRKSDHETVGRVVSADLVGRKFAARRARPANTSPSQCGRQSTALADNSLFRTSRAINSGPRGQAYYVACLRSALRSGKILPLLIGVVVIRSLDVYSTADARERFLSMTIAASEIATKAALNGVEEAALSGRECRYRLRQLSRQSASDPRQIRGVEHQEPEVPDRNTADLSLAGKCLVRMVFSSSPARSLILAALAVSGASYQYSSRAGQFPSRPWSGTIRGHR